MDDKYTAEEIAKLRRELILMIRFKTGNLSDVDENARMIAEILSILEKRNISISHASALLDDCKTFLGIIGRI